MDQQKESDDARNNAEGMGEDCVDAGPARSGQQTIAESPSSGQLSSKGASGQLDGYKMNHENRGLFIIFNHEKFDPQKDGGATLLPDRVGTDKDRERLKQTAETLGFEVKVHENLTKKEILEVIKKTAKDDHTDNDCFACAILTHGGDDEVLFAKDDMYKLKDLAKLLTPDKCPTLTGKPKLFFIQACRGETLDDGVKHDVTDGMVYSDSMPKNKIPLESDFLFAHSTCRDYYSWRNKANGSIFMQTLCNCLNNFDPRLDLLQILTRVSNKVAVEFESNCPTDEKKTKKKQMPSITSRLRFEVYFHAKK